MTKTLSFLGVELSKEGLGGKRMQHWRKGNLTRLMPAFIFIQSLMDCTINAKFGCKCESGSYLHTLCLYPPAYYAAPARAPDIYITVHVTDDPQTLNSSIIPAPRNPPR